MNKEMLQGLLDKAIKVDRGGPESRIGKLLAVHDDYFVLYTEDEGVIYYRMQHVKSITLDTKTGHKFSSEVPEGLSVMQEPLFKTIVGSVRHEWVKINRGGPETIEGILEQVTDDYVTVISNGEVLHLAMYHIRNISVGVKEENKEKEENNTNAKQNRNSGRK